MKSPPPQLAFTLDGLKSYLAQIFPQIWATGTHEIEAIGPLSARVRLVFHPDHLRPGGTISGPSLFALADLALYVAILAQIGRVPLAVTTNLNIN
ncbi:MAG TPA: PaaI family thioesterase, partial [Roseiarcus sp.]|nr:PaaI family thioesterase [Roseiarcus sp.]